MAIWLLNFIVTTMPLTLAQRISALMVKLMNYEEGDYEGIVEKINRDADQFDLHSMSEVSHAAYCKSGV